MTIRIIDLDNCIADDAWRIPRIEWQHTNPMRRYHAYHSLAPFDVCRNREIFEGVKDNIVVFTARPFHYRAATEEWLGRNGVPVKCLIMRNDEDHRPSVMVKEWQLNILLAHYHVHEDEILAAHDDREDICAMFERRGIPATRTRIHDVCAYTQPTKESA